MIKKYVFAGLWSAFYLTLAFAQEKKLPMDSSVRMGTLPNGFSYFIKANKQPEKRATIYLANKVGSILETEKERGIAHFIEHMNFNGTKHFPKNELIAYLERSGVKFGADLNAYTAFDGTVYKLPLPTDDSVLWKNGIQVMRDWAAEALFEKEEFERERGVIMEEKRLRANASGRMSEKYRPVLYNHSRYALRSPIGLESVIKHADVSVAKDFYKTWYRPDLQALIVVGDIDVQEVEQQLIAAFSDLPEMKNPAKREVFDIRLQDSTSYIKVTDPEYNRYTVHYFFKTYTKPLLNEEDFKEQLAERLLNNLSAARLRYVYNQKKQDYINAGIGVSSVVANLKALQLSVNLNPENLKEGFQAFWTEMERIRRLGFTDQEFVEAKERLASSLEMAMKEQEKIPSVNYADGYLHSFLNDEVSLSLEERFRLTKIYLERLQLSDIQKLILKFLSGKDRTVLVLGPEKRGSILPDRAQLGAWQQAVESQTLEPLKEELAVGTLMEHYPVPGRVIKEERIDSLDLLHWQLSNGMNLYLKKTDFKNDEILFSLFSKGGTSLYDDAEFPSARNAAAITLSSGAGHFNSNQLKRMLNGKAIRVEPYIADRSEGISGAASVKDFSTALEMVYLYMLQPRLDTARFNIVIEQSKAALRNRIPNAARDFTDTISYVLGGHHPRRKPIGIVDLDQIDSSSVHRIFRERFANAADFSGVIVGNLPIDSMRTWAERYLASLPGEGKLEVARDLHIRVPEGKLRKDLTGNKGDKASVQLVISGQYKYVERNNRYLDLLKASLGFRLNERLREQEGGVYSPAVYITKAKEPIGFFAFTISFDCDPARVEQLIKATEEEVDRLAVEGVSADDLQKFVAEESRAHQVQKRTNGFWLNYLKGQMETGGPLERVLDYEQELRQLNLKESVRYGKQFLKRNNEIIFTLRP